MTLEGWGEGARGVEGCAWVAVEGIEERETRVQRWNRLG